MGLFKWFKNKMIGNVVDEVLNFFMGEIDTRKNFL
jgi:hypothetical protein